MYPTPSHVMHDLTASYPVLQSVSDSIEAAFILLCNSLRADGTVLVCGNGGSAADSEHIAGEMLKGFLSHRPLPAVEKAALCAQGDDGALLAECLQQGLRCIALTGHPALTTAVANDTAAEVIFAQQVNALGRPGDVLLGISTSGNARNVILAAKTARARAMSVVALTGESGGALRDIADIVISVPETVTHKVQELHLPVYHTLCAMLECEFFPADVGL